jgi:hypothetical protein
MAKGEALVQRKSQRRKCSAHGRARAFRITMVGPVLLQATCMCLTCGFTLMNRYMLRGLVIAYPTSGRDRV